MEYVRIKRKKSTRHKTHLKSMLPASWNAPPSSLWYPYEAESQPGILPFRGKRDRLRPTATQSGITCGGLQRGCPMVTCGHTTKQTTMTQSMAQAVQYSAHTHGSLLYHNVMSCDATSDIVNANTYHISNGNFIPLNPQEAQYDGGDSRQQK